jgi:phenylacetate-coenzyme A ligase PaaK-like adenylate-forming protein
VLFPLHERLKGKPTFRWLPELERTQWLQPAALREYQFRRMHRLVEWAYAHVPYYRALLEEHELPPSRIQTHDDFHRIPYLTREHLKKRFDDLRARAKLVGVHARSSGGSTGSPVTVLVDMERMGIQEAARLRAHRWFGVEPGDRELLVWGSPLEITRQDRIRQVRDFLMNSKMLDAFDLGPDVLPALARAMLRYGPRLVYGYANAVYLVARYFQREAMGGPRQLRVVFTTAEPLHDFQRRMIRAAWGCGVAEEYGTRDGGLAAFECPEGGLHTFAEGSYLEIKDPDADGRGEIVLTCLDSLALPTIRYRTGDIGRLDPAPCRCGRGLPKIDPVEGRLLDFLVTPHGRILHPTSVMHILREIPVVRESRVVQEALDRIVVHLVPVRPMTKAELDDLRAKFVLLLGPDIRAEIIERSELPPTTSGKFRPVESRVGREIVEHTLSARS